MTFGRGPLLLLKYKILPIRRKKPNIYIVTLKVHVRNREGLICPDNLFFIAQYTYTERKKVYSRLALILIIALRP